MRTSRDITVTDNGTELKFRITALSALGLQKWAAKAGVALAAAGLLDAPSGGDISIEQIARGLASQGFKILGRLDADEANALMIELLCKCVTRIDGAGAINLTESEIDAIFSDIKALLTLEKEALAVNFSFLMNAVPANSPGQQAAENSTSPRISIRH